MLGELLKVLQMPEVVKITLQQRDETTGEASYYSLSKDDLPEVAVDTTMDKFVEPIKPEELGAPECSAPNSNEGNGDGKINWVVRADGTRVIPREVRNDIIARRLQGEMPSEIAKHYGLSRRKVGDVLYKEARHNPELKALHEESTRRLKLRGKASSDSSSNRCGPLNIEWIVLSNGKRVLPPAAKLDIVERRIRGEKPGKIAELYGVQASRISQLLYHESKDNKRLKTVLKGRAK